MGQGCVAVVDLGEGSGGGGGFFGQNWGQRGQKKLSFHLYVLVVSTCIFVLSSCMYLYLLLNFRVSTSTYFFFKSCIFHKIFL